MQIQPICAAFGQKASPYNRLDFRLIKRMFVVAPFLPPFTPLFEVEVC